MTRTGDRDARRVLLIDDDRWVRALFADVLVAMGLRVDAAASGDDGLARLEKGGYHLVITDLDLGPPGGLAVAAAARQGTARVPVIIMSGAAGRLGDEEKVARECAVLTKPVRVADLQAAVLSALPAGPR